MDIESLHHKAREIRRETIRIHGIFPETRIASSLSPVEILVSLYYGGILAYDPRNPKWEARDRLIVSKGHGGIALYPILSDVGFFEPALLDTISQQNSMFGSIPDCAVPGIETINGSLGHGLGVAAGVALGLRAKGNPANVFVLVGDGELYEGAVWEAMMFAAHQQLSNLCVIVDNNKISMLDFCANTLDHAPLWKKFDAFGLNVQSADGHDLAQLYPALRALKQTPASGPKLLIAQTVKGKGVPALEGDPLCHVRSLSQEDVAKLLEEVV